MFPGSSTQHRSFPEARKSVSVEGSKTKPAAAAHRQKTVEEKKKRMMMQKVKVVNIYCSHFAPCHRNIIIMAENISLLDEP